MNVPVLTLAKRALTVATAVAATLLGGAMIMTATTAGHADPPGNNGTVKIAPHGDIDDIPNNTPHVGCTFQIEWYDFDEVDPDTGEAIVSNVTFAMQPPTADVGLSGTDPAQVTLESDPASGAGNDFDGVQVYNLVFDGDPHPVQGYHVKLTVNTPGSIGADVKHKVFWVQGCAPPPTTSTTETSGTTATTATTGTTATTQTSGTQATSTPTSTPTQTATATATSQSPSVAGEQAEVPAGVSAGLGEQQSNDGGLGSGLIAVIGLLTMVLGAALLGTSLASRIKS